VLIVLSKRGLAAALLGLGRAIGARMVYAALTPGRHNRRHAAAALISSLLNEDLMRTCVRI
jgi:hypothetical protein